MPHAQQLRNSFVEAAGLSQSAAAAYGVSSLRSGGDTLLARRGVPQEHRCRMGHRATGAVELRCVCELAIEHMQQHIDAGCAL